MTLSQGNGKVINKISIYLHYFGHHMMAWFQMLDRDRDRLADARRRINVSPLGAAALAGTSFPIDREATARELGFDAPSENSLDTVSDRDFVIEYCGHAALLAVHLSRMAEELIIWASERYRFIEIGDAFCTGLLTPNKVNFPSLGQSTTLR